MTPQGRFKRCDDQTFKFLVSDNKNLILFMPTEFLVRTHPYPAYLVGRGIAAACAKPRRAASTSPAKPVRIIFCSRPTTITTSPASSGSIRRCAKRATRNRCGRRSRDGTIDLIATDHAPHTPEEKTRNDIWAVDCGFPGVETQMPLMLTEVNQRPACRSAIMCG